MSGICGIWGLAQAIRLYGKALQRNVIGAAFFKRRVF
jgi:hypothetical protein